MDAPPLSWESLIGSLAPEDRAAVTRSGTERLLAQGDLLFREGDRGDSLHVILEGEIRLRFDGVAGEKLLGPGQIVGEIALLTPGQRRSASAEASCPTRLLTLDQGAVSELSRRNPGVLVTLLRSACTYLLDSERRLIEDLRRKCGELERTLDYLRRTKEELSSQELLALTDELTGLYNRRCLNLQLESFITRSAGTGQGLSLMLIDLDGLKPLNDRYGHAAGDAALRLVADVIKKCVRKVDLPCRIGGDEFALVLYQSPVPQAVLRARQIGRAVASEAGSALLSVTVSIGGTMLVPGDTAEKLVERADGWLYMAKNSGRNCVVWEGRVVEEVH